MKTIITLIILTIYGIYFFKGAIQLHKEALLKKEEEELWQQLYKEWGYK